MNESVHRSPLQISNFNFALCLDDGCFGLRFCDPLNLPGCKKASEGI